jgi:hypothetical protein
MGISIFNNDSVVFLNGVVNVKFSGIKYFIFLILILSVSFRVSAVELEDFSENKSLYISDIVFLGNNILTEKELIVLSGLDKKTGIFVRDLRIGIDKLKKSGYFASVSFMIYEGVNGYKLEISLKENPPLASLKVVDSRFLDLTVFQKKLIQRKVGTDMVYSQVQLQNAIDDFNIYNQNIGIFLYAISFKEVTRDEILKSGGVFLYDQDELKKSGIHIIIYIKNVPKIIVGNVYMKGVSISYDKILSYIQLKRGMQLSSDSDLYFSYKRMKRLGFFEKVYFKLVPLEDIIYGIEIVTDEVTISEITSSLTAPQNIGVIMTAEYYNIAVAGSLQRLRLGAGWEILPSAPVFVAEYTHPYFFEGLFFDTMFTKSDTADTMEDSTNLKLHSVYEGKITTGMNLFSNLFSYLYHKETYEIVDIVDENYKIIKQNKQTKELEHSSGVLVIFDDVDDNFFISQGYKFSGYYEATWKNPLSYKTGCSGEVYVPVPFFNLIAALNSRSNFLIADKKDTTSTLKTDDRMRTSVQEVENSSETTQIKMTTYSSAELRFPFPTSISVLQDLSFVIFGEAGGAWSGYNNMSLQQAKFGFGIGLRMSPRKHYSSFLFQFPAGLYLGYRISDTKVKTTLVSHRDNTYYISLGASF